MEMREESCYLVGIKGTGMANLALLLMRMGASVRGCDVQETFLTDLSLHRGGIVVDTGFDPAHLSGSATMVIHSSAYHRDLPILQAAEAKHIPLYSYPEFLALLSTKQDSYAVAGTHGKTTTTSVAAHILKEASEGDFPFYALYGSSALNQEDALYQGSECALFEACEYQDHFLSYHLRGVLVTCIEYDHPDYFADLDAVKASFRRLVDKLEKGGMLIVCSDDREARELLSYARRTRSDLTLLEYGFTAPGPFRILENPDSTFSLSLLPEYSFALSVHAKALVLDHIGAVVLALSVLLDRPKPRLYLQDKGLLSDEVLPSVTSLLMSQLASFPGCRARTEVLAEEGGVVYVDDYAHHPSEILTSLEELRSAYPHSKQLVLFCPHTASRTKAFLSSFASALAQADALIIQSTYASARQDSCAVEDTSALLLEAVQEAIGTSGKPVAYAKDDQACVELAGLWLQERWLCITMGAGNNRPLGPHIAAFRRSLS